MGLFDIDFHKLKKDIGSKTEELAKTAQKKVNGVSNNVAPTLNQAVKTQGYPMQPVKLPQKPLNGVMTSATC